MRIIVAGGGTGGHFFPAVATIEKLMENGHDVLYIGTENGIEFQKQSRIPCKKMFLPISGVRGKGFAGSLKGAASLFLAIRKMKKIANNYKPDRILLFGGYVSFPAGVVGKIKKIPVIIHEQNSIPGKTNKILNKIGNKTLIANSFCFKYFPKGILTGNPLRKEIIECNISKKEAREKLGIDIEKFTILIFGGSQGALFINQLMEKTVPLLKDKEDIQILHITGKEKEGRLKEVYNSLNISAKVISFTDTPWLFYKSADIAISRSGALAVSELCFFGIPTVFIPYPFAADDHQYFNVKLIEEKEGCFLYRQKNLTPEKLAFLIKKLYTNESLREQFSKVMKSFSIPDATLRVVRETENAGD
ncbi:undecaprenyldiphospho-muramoylpentapeptide beta-N-acetylglucosaminyltransferase [Desulfurobacterium atlanticum]|uniref:UDP-N-acetylglucosamine--N-acetylmuramyl-(pentapeptide) pyrophosphoryl-undecaprenol N-acetylglucosamine transferase n=1 Tax=Desulfurobacterium atlanticum TaxID=240169 RepID=A0A238Z4U4_9BACT|nr:undecaprenyldiphospho-muramoylpentapeptide beta-N-acetylglucosaminyltransferase [Desulfurobacterium atlanticum]SNR77951.1 UDP-N-acetylglucosamine-N-acetylmuramylpentapeptide N-acetylglucosamine transferase [Desulfurobacterium atlanticum]